MQKITPHLWYDSQAEEAANFYVSVFSGRGKDSKILNISRYPKAAEEVSGKKAGSVMAVEFQLAGQKFVALNGGAPFKLSEAISFIVDCKDQEEVDYYWGKLSEGGDPQAQVCGWLKDKFGLSWQIVPVELTKLLQDPVKSEKVMAALLQMKKIDIVGLKKAAEEK